MQEKGAIINVEGHIGFSITTSRLPNQFCTLPDKYHRISGNYNKFNQNRIIPLKRESSKNSYAISENIGPEISVCDGGLSSDRNNTFNSLTVLQVPLHYCYLQKQQIDKLRTFPSYIKQIVLSPQKKAEIQW